METKVAMLNALLLPLCDMYCYQHVLVPIAPLMCKSFPSSPHSCFMREKNLKRKHLQGSCKVRYQRGAASSTFSSISQILQKIHPFIATKATWPVFTSLPSHEHNLVESRAVALEF
jgi:hypothetical protein